MTTFKAYRLFAEGGRVSGHVVDIALDELSPGDVVIRNAFASVNYKDALAGLGRNKIIRDYPRIGGIDLFGTVAESRDPRFRSGDSVVVHGFGVGVDHDGGYAEYARVNGDWVMPLPRGLTLQDAAAVGVAGYTAALSIHLMELNGLRPASGPVLVNGATGGVASIAIDMLSGRGYAVTAVTGKTAEHDYLKQLGATDVIDRLSLEPQSSTKPLEKALWAGALDSLGGNALGWLTRTMQPQGVIAAFGNALGQDLHTTVLPFILRGVRLIGINANSPMELRQQIWRRIADDLKPRHLTEIVRHISLAQLPEAFQCLIDNRSRGRIVVVL
jgi:putative YhdH/YhfP family quinone oxidoreductase